MSDLVFVDTSIWVEALRGQPRETMAQLQDLLDLDRVAIAAPVRLEILAGASKRNISALSESLSPLPTFYPARNTWEIVERWIHLTVGVGERFAVADLLIAGLAFERKGKLWSRDGDFQRMADLGFIHLYDPDCGR